jgi:hypothetical protein
MFSKIPLILIFMVSFARAECYVRSAVTNTSEISISEITDVEPWVVPTSETQNKCIVNFRALVAGKWISAVAEHSGQKSVSEKDLCKVAIDKGRVQLLSRANGGRISIEQNMVCDDRPVIQVRPVNRGEMIRESEVRPHPNFPKSFTYRAAVCRWFIEPRVVVGRDLLQYQGIICQMNGSQWQVVDKW